MKAKWQKQWTMQAKFFDSLAHARRLAIVSAIHKAGTNGLNFGQLAHLTGIADSTLSHHLQIMKRSGLIQSRSQGASTILMLNYPLLQKTLNNFQSGINTAD